MALSRGNVPPQVPLTPTRASPRARPSHLAHLTRMTFLNDDDVSSNDGSDATSTVDSEGRSASFSDGVCYDRVENLMDVRSLLGLPGGLILDTQVIAHSCFSTPPQDTEVLVKVGKEGRAINLPDVENALQSIPIDCFNPGRSYFWEGIQFARGGKKAYIRWGS